MIQLNPVNVLLKRSHRKQLMAWLRRSIRLGERLGDFLLTITMRKVGGAFVVSADVHDAAGDFTCRCRGGDWRGTLRSLVQLLNQRLHDQCLMRARTA